MPLQQVSGLCAVYETMMIPYKMFNVSSKTVQNQTEDIKTEAEEDDS